MDLIIKNGTVVTPSGMYKADVGVQDGKIVEIAASIPAEAKEVVDAAGKLVLPGAIDGHTHLAMPFGGTISSDDYFAGTRAAACGGTTTVFDFAMQDFGESMVDTIKRRDAMCAPDAAVDVERHAMSKKGPETKKAEKSRENIKKAQFYVEFHAKPGDKLQKGA